MKNPQVLSYNAETVEVSDPAVHRLLSGLGVSVSLKRKTNGGMSSDEPPAKHGVEIFNSSGRVVNQFTNLLPAPAEVRSAFLFFLKKEIQAIEFFFIF